MNIEELVTLAKTFRMEPVIARVNVDHMDTLKPLFDFPGGWSGTFTDKPSSFGPLYDLRGIPVYVDETLPPRTIELSDEQGDVLWSTTMQSLTTEGSSNPVGL